jgi:hypothetical protein
MTPPDIQAVRVAGIGRRRAIAAERPAPGATLRG